MKDTIYIILILLLSSIIYSCDSTTHKELPTSSTSETINATTNNASESSDKNQRPNRLYVMALNGLNMRSSGHLGAEILTRIPYGELVVRMGNDAKPTSVEGFEGHMVKAIYGNLEGYVFDGYLSQFPPEQEEEATKAYIHRLKELEFITKGGSIFEKGDGYTTGVDSVFLPTNNMQEAFLVASCIHPYLLKFSYPSGSSEETEDYENPEKQDDVFEDKLTISRDEEGRIVKMRHLYTNEVAGEQLAIDREENGISIKYRFGVD